ncbi:small membrane protein [Klebsiella indica]|uniref:Small membrane protein n=1 Tax=Klebsiella indica TaxID=2582917 RepID=A0A5R9LA32_9ENTR|nr:small membrane protein [Klebsiella indica]TLV06866.1 small membrane protein [Klebsiella indica]
MANVIFLIVAAILLIISIFSLVSYIKDQRKNKLTFNKHKW